MLRNFVLIHLIFLSSVFALAADAIDSSKPSKGSFSFYIENDTKKIGGPGTDRSYTNGFRASYLFAEDKIPSWAPPMINWSEDLKAQLKNSKTNFSFSLGQQIYTPSDTDATALITDDRPYAGWLYLGFMANFKTGQDSQLVELSLGVIGPEALGEQVQNEFHRMIDTPTAVGWKNQLRSEPALQISYQKRHRFFELHEGSNRFFDAIPYYGAALGNVHINVHVGGLVRFGHHLVDDFGPTRPSNGDGDSFIASKVSTSPVAESQSPSYYLVAGVRANAISRNLFLDGSSFHESHHVTKYPFIGESDIGVGLQWKHWSLVWRYVTRSPEFEQKSFFNSFASVSVSVSNL